MARLPIVLAVLVLASCRAECQLAASSPLKAEGSALNRDLKSSLAEFPGRHLKDLTENELNNITAMFYRMDKNDSKSLDAKELVEFGRQVGFNVNEAEAQNIIENFDTNHDGVLQLDEFIKVYKESHLLGQN
jgi:Ca2+-binding EF-hand superfamily protein